MRLFPFFAASLGLPAFALAEVVAAQDGAVPETVDFNRDVRPILSENCFKCHGFDDQTREADRRLDTREGALADIDGFKAIVPGNVGDSDVHVRIHSAETDEMMPPAKSGKKLTERQKAIIDRWIQTGAVYAKHWSFEPPRQTAPTAVEGELSGRVANPIDAFIFNRLQTEGLKPSEEADRYTLARRVWLDLIGLPPTPEEADAYVNDPSPGAYEALVDRLLASPRYGERWARPWLDLARYADTNGYEKDRNRSIWPWRDWVIKALNADMPFDQFTIEQLAGDTLPNATRDQIIATGFHRNTMLNEEGGIDPLEFRYHAMTDRVATTGTTWLALTVGCAQCHSHKYDPIQHREYFQLMAFLDNADEPDLDLPPPDFAAQLEAHEKRIAQLLAELPGKWPIEQSSWQTPRPVSVETQSGEVASLLDDGSALLAGESADKDTYTVTIDTDSGVISELRLEAMTDDALPAQGPGRVKHGNFVLSEITVTAAPKETPASAQPVKLTAARADFSQVNLPVEHAIDGNPGTGWAVDRGDGKPVSTKRTAAFTFAKPVGFPGGTRLVVQLVQQFGAQHTMGRVRLSTGTPLPQAVVATQRQAAIEAGFAEWLARERQRVVVWEPLVPAEAKSNSPLLTVQPDASVFASGDITKSDTYKLKFVNVPAGITSLRLEALPDDRLPAHGPGMAYYEGPKGDFLLADLKARADGQPVKFGKVTESFAKSAAARAIDDDLQTGWSTTGREGQAHQAVFQLESPLSGARELEIEMLFANYYAASLGRFRISATIDPRRGEARDFSDEIAALLRASDAELSAAQRERLRAHFLVVAPELISARAEIDKVRAAAPRPPTTLVMSERPASNPRPTLFRKRGEYLQPAERVEAGVFSFLPALQKGEAADRLTFARWLVSAGNPLTARVVVNRAWAALLGRGLVKTTEDFGSQGGTPSHPELLDWLAVEFMKGGWSMKKLHRLIVTSSTYRQSSRVPAELLARDPENRLLARGPRCRLEAEMVRDVTLRSAGLLSSKIGGPSVYPPQPEGGSEVSYGSPTWTVSQGEDRYRRALYTFARRTTPFAMATTFDAPTGEACVPRREVSNTPLQALAVLNDVVFTEAAQALGKQMAARVEAPEERMQRLFRLCLTRPAKAEEITALNRFFETHKERFRMKEIDALKVAGPGEGDAVERAAWTVVARAIFNLDEAITRS